MDFDVISENICFIMIDKGQIVPKAGAWAKDGYQISYDATPTYEKALVNYLIGKY